MRDVLDLNRASLKTVDNQCCRLENDERLDLRNVQKLGHLKDYALLSLVFQRNMDERHSKNLVLQKKANLITAHKIQVYAIVKKFAMTYECI